MEKNMSDIVDYSTESLKLLTDKFKEKNIFHWIDFGTLLSAYRDGKMFEHDYDVDVCVFKDDKKTAGQKSLRNIILCIENITSL